MKQGNDNDIVRLHNEGKSYREIGHLIGISHVAVRKRYLRAVKRSARVNCEVASKINTFQLSPPNEEREKKVNVKFEYYRHIPTGLLFSKNETESFTDEFRAQLEPYFPSKYLRKTSEPNMGEIFIWTLILARRRDMEPYDGRVPAPKV